MVGEAAEEGGADSAHAEGETEKQAGDGADLVGHQVLRVDQDGGEGDARTRPITTVRTQVQNSVA